MRKVPLHNGLSVTFGNLLVFLCTGKLDQKMYLYVVSKDSFGMAHYKE